MRETLLVLFFLLNAATLFSQRAEIIRTYDVGSARQAVAVDDTHFYVINNTNIHKHSKDNGELIKSWEGKEQGIIHLNSGYFHQGKLYCAHSSFPGVPMASSIEIFDPATLTPVATISLGIDPHGSLTWIYFHDNHWWAGFAWYSGKHAVGTKDNRYTTVVKYTPDWQKLEAWTFPPDVIKNFGDYSNSGAVWTPDGRLLCTGHDEQELYELKIPAQGYQLQLLKTISTPGITGQGISIDRSVKGKTVIYGINRMTNQITVSEIR